MPFPSHTCTAPSARSHHHAAQDVNVRSESLVEVKKRASGHGVYSISSDGVGKYAFDELRQKESGQLGRGAQARVQLYEHTPTGELLAMKIVSFGPSMSTSGLESDLQHVVTMETHPNIVQSLDVYFRDGMLMILMEYCSRGSLGDLLERIRRKNVFIPDAVLASMTKQVVQGLVHLHSMNMIHRDLKPSNILVDGSGVVKICDFGVSRIVSTEKMVHTAVGASAYLSPERVRGEGYFQPSDVWALGVTVAELALGDYPWKEFRHNPIALSELLSDNRASINWPSGGDHSDALKSFVEKCLEHDPKERATMEELLTHPFLNDVGGNEESSAVVVAWLDVHDAPIAKKPSAATLQGWRKCVDSKGRVFYHNKLTGEKVCTNLSREGGKKKKIPTTTTNKLPKCTNTDLGPPWNELHRAEGDMSGFSVRPRAYPPSTSIVLPS